MVCPGLIFSSASLIVRYVPPFFSSCETVSTFGSAFGADPSARDSSGPAGSPESDSCFATDPSGGNSRGHAQTKMTVRAKAMIMPEATQVRRRQSQDHGSKAVIVIWRPCQFTRVERRENDADEPATYGASAAAASAAVWKRSAGCLAIILCTTSTSPPG